MLNDGPWTILGHYLTISKWKPNFKPSAQEPHTTLAWVRFQGLPLEVFEEPSLMSAGNALGRAIRVDPITADMICGRYARVCVELNLDKPLIPMVAIWGKKYSVEYEGLHRICFHCGCYGHKMEACGTKAPSSDNPPGVATDKPKIPCSTAATPFGPWMLPAHIRRKQQALQARLNRRSFPSEANCRLNAQIEEELRAARHRDPTSDGSPNFVFGTVNENRGKQVSDVSTGKGGKSTYSSGGGNSRFSILHDVGENSDVDLSLLRQQIKNIPAGPHRSTHEMAQIKIEKGLKSKGSAKPNVSRGKDRAKTGEQPRASAVAPQRPSRIPPTPPRSGSLQALDGNTPSLRPICSTAQPGKAAATTSRAASQNPLSTSVQPSATQLAPTGKSPQPLSHMDIDQHQPIHRTGTPSQSVAAISVPQSVMTADTSMEVQVSSPPPSTVS